MLLPLVEYVPAEPAPSRNILGIVRFGSGVGLDGSGIALALPPLGAARVEVWRTSRSVERGEERGVRYGHDGESLFGAVVDPDDDIEAGARRAYAAVVAVSRSLGYPNLTRVWNHVRDINAGDGDLERYKRFCAGRYDALTAAGFEKPDFPAASTVGMSSGSLGVYFIASRKPVANVENPRQMSAYNYPRQYGVRSPAFARATIAGASVFVSGTASVVGHETAHPGDVAAQTAETVANLTRILSVCGAEPPAVHAVKVYVRRAADAPAVEPALAAAFPGASRVVLSSAVCRRELLLEAEAIAEVE